MADRRSDDAPLPRRSLAPSKPAEQKAARRPFAERVSSAITGAGTKVQAAATSRPSGSTAGAGTAGRSGSSVSSGRTSAGAGTDDTKGAASRSGTAAPRPKGTRRARLRLVHLDPWSVMKTSFLLSIAFGIVTVVAVAVVWSVLGAAGVWDSINSTVSDVVGGDSAQNFDVQNYVGTSRVLGFTMVVAVADVLLITAIATLSAFLYNLAAALLGGVEVTLAEDER